MVVGGVDGEEVFEPGDVGVGVAAGGTEHGGGARSLHHFQLWAHVYGGEPRGQLVLWKEMREVGAEVRQGEEVLDITIRREYKKRERRLKQTGHSCQLFEEIIDIQTNIYCKYCNSFQYIVYNHQVNHTFQIVKT